MITTAAIIITLALTLATLVTSTRRTQRSKVTAEASLVLAPQYGLDPSGVVWSVRALDAASVRLYRGAHVHVDACGFRTLETLTDRYSISWER